MSSNFFSRIFGYGSRTTSAAPDVIEGEISTIINEDAQRQLVTDQLKNEGVDTIDELVEELKKQRNELGDHVKKNLPTDRGKGLDIKTTIERMEKIVMDYNKLPPKLSAPPVDVPFDTIYIFHDSENCPIPRKYITRDKNMKSMKYLDNNKEKVVFGDYPDGKCEAQFDVIVREVLRTAMSSYVGMTSDELTLDRKDFDILEYNLIVPSERNINFQMGEKTKKGSHSLGIYTIEADNKEGAVDNKIKDCIGKKIRELKHTPEERKKKILFILISGDRDFSNEVRLIQDTSKYDVVIIHSEDSNSDFLRSLLTYENRAHQCWNAIVEKSQTISTRRQSEVGGAGKGTTKMGGGGKSGGDKGASGGGARLTEVGEVELKNYEYKFLQNYGADALRSCLESVDKSFVPTLDARQGKYFLTARSLDNESPELTTEQLNACFPPLMSFKQKGLVQVRFLEIKGVSPLQISEDVNIKQGCRDLRIGLYVYSCYSLERVLVVEKLKAMQLTKIAEICKNDLKLSLLRVGPKTFEKYETMDQQKCPPDHERIRVKFHVPPGQDEGVVQSKFLSHKGTEAAPFTFKLPEPFESTKVHLIGLKSEEANLIEMKEKIESMSIVSVSHEVAGYDVKIVLGNFSRFRSLVESLDCSVDLPDKLPLEPKVSGPLPTSVETASKAPVLKLTFRGNVDKCENAKKAFIDLLNTKNVHETQIKITTVGICVVAEYKKSLLMKDYNSNGGADESSAGDESSADDDSGSQNSPCSISLYRTFKKKAGDAMEAFLNVAICYLPPETEDERVFEKDQFDVMKESLDSELSLYNETVVDFNSIRNTFDQVALTKESRLKALLYPLDGVWFVKLQLKKEVIVGGTEDGVREARGFLETLPQEDQIVVESVEVDDPKHASLLVSAPYTQALQALMDLATLPSEAKRLDKKKGKSATTIFTLEGKRSAIQSIKDNVKTQADIWARELKREPLNDFLDPLILSYLKDEGSSMLKHTAKKCGVVVTSPDSPIVPSLSHADLSINRKLMSGEITGKRCSVFVSVEVGDLLKAVCQSIANPANRSLANTGGVAKAISVAGGVKFDEDCKSYIKQYGKISMGAAVAVGRVKDTAVVHAVGPTFSDFSIEHSSRLYEKTIRSALSTASDGGYESIALPLFGSGIYGWNAETAANLTIRAISSWASEAPKTIQIVLVMTDATKDAMVNAIRDFSRLPLPSDVNADATPALSPPKFSCFWQNDSRGWTPYDYDQSMKIERAIDKNEFPVTLRGDKGGQHSDSKHIPAGEDSALYTVERKSIVSFDGEKCSYVQKNIVSKFERPVKIRPFDPSNPMPLFSSYQTPMASSEVIRYSALTLHSTPTKVASGGGSKVTSGGGSSSASPPAPPLKRIQSLGGSLDDKLIEGSRKCIMDFKTAIGAIVEEKKREEDIDLSSLKEYGNDLMNLFEDGSASIDVISGQKHHFKLTAYGRAFDDANRRVLKFKTKILEDLSRTVWPEYWPKQIEYDLSQPQCEFVEVPSGSQEYSFVEEEFRGRTKGPRDLFHKDIVKIERVQNPVLWDAYYNYCKHLASKAGSSVDSSSSLFKKVNEHWTKHGTSKTDPKVVAGSEAGVDARHCTSGLFGTGAYTAEDAEYSHSKNFCYTCPSGDMQMLLVRVAAGKISEQGESTNDTRALIKPPPGHDSVRGVVARDFKALIVYSYQAIYPAYLITYKK